MPEFLIKAAKRKPINPDEIYVPKTHQSHGPEEEEEDTNKPTFTEEEFLKLKGNFT